MKTNHFVFIVLIVYTLLSASYCAGQTYTPRLLRFEEEYSGLTDSVKADKPWLRIKNIQFKDAGSIRANLGLDWREMYELVQGFDSLGVKDGYWLTRLMVHADIHFANRIRTFFQLGRGIIAERQLPIRPVDEDELFFLNAFAEYRFGKDRVNYVRAGRQELFFGMGRLIAPREGPNIRNTYDAVRVHKNAGAFALDGFISYLVNNKKGILDDEAFGNNQRLWGLYCSSKGKKIDADVYYVGFYNPSALYSKQSQRSKETRHSIGTRLYGKICENFIFDGEITYQFGSFGRNMIRSFMIDGKISKGFRVGKSFLKPSFKMGYSAGNCSVTNRELNTFNPLFPNLLYYQTAIGIFPSNIINPQAALGWDYKKLAVSCGADMYWRASEQDGLYAPSGNISLSNGNEKYLGYQLYLKADYTFTQNFGCTFLLSRYFKSDFVSKNSSRQGVDLLINVLLNYKL